MEPEEKAKSAEAKKAQLRAALAGMPIAPEVTSDEVDLEAPRDSSRDAEFRANKPPHHG